jgi:chromosomal replication initiator protein
MAHEAARRLAEDQNPIFGALGLYGVCGVGKTHLLQGIARRFAELRPGSRVKYTTTERFANEYIALIREGKPDEFRRRYRPLDLLCLDDVHFLSGKKATQSEFLHTFEALELSGARVVLASDEHPKMIRDLHASIVSRVSSGIIVEIEAPDRETRVRLVRALGERRGVAFEDGAAEELAGACRGSVRDIEGAVTRVEAYSRLLGPVRDGASPITLSAVRQVASGDRSRVPKRPIRLGEILEAACSVVRVEASEVLGPGRHRRIVLARSLAARLARDLTNHSFPEIARAMNRRNHSTIVTASQRIGRQIERGDTVRDEPSLREIRVADLYDQARGRLLGRAG